MNLGANEVVGGDDLVLGFEGLDEETALEKDYGSKDE